MSKFIDLTGKRFGRLTVVQRLGSDRWGNSRWLCKCDCNSQETIVSSGHLRSNHTQSCGCFHLEKITKHGHAIGGKESKTYRSWDHMIQRCTNPNFKQYKDYGGRGITVCERWNKFENFLEDMEEAPKGLQLDRINNNKEYYKENCRWATKKQQHRNTRKNHLETYDGKIQCIAAWAEKFNINTSTLISRINILGWSIKKALTTPVRKCKRK